MGISGPMLFPGGDGSGGGGVGMSRGWVCLGGGYVQGVGSLRGGYVWKGRTSEGWVPTPQIWATMGYGRQVGGMYHTGNAFLFYQYF